MPFLAPDSVQQARQNQADLATFAVRRWGQVRCCRHWLLGAARRAPSRGLVPVAQKHQHQSAEPFPAALIYHSHFAAGAHLGLAGCRVFGPLIELASIAEQLPVIE